MKRPATSPAEQWHATARRQPPSARTTAAVAPDSSPATRQTNCASKQSPGDTDSPHKKLPRKSQSAHPETAAPEKTSIGLPRPGRSRYKRTMQSSTGRPKSTARPASTTPEDKK